MEISPKELVTKGEEIYEQELKAKLEPIENGKFVAIEVDSKKHYIDQSKDGALDLAKKDFPDKLFFVRKIGELERVSFLGYTDSLSRGWLYL